MKIGILGSSGGSAFEAAFRIWRAANFAETQFCVFTDRACGLEEIALREKMPLFRAQADTNDEISLAAKEFFEGQRVDAILLFYSRLVTPTLFDALPVFNIHPALLPAFPGLNAVQRAHESRARFLGATLHQVDAGVDTGPIIAQNVMPVPPETALARMNKFSFIQKTYLTLVLWELLATEELFFDSNHALLKSGLSFTDRCNPALQAEKLLFGIMELQQSEGVDVVP